MTAVRRPLRPGRDAAPRGLLLVALPEEIDADLVAIDPGQLATAIGKARRRQQQEEFLQMQALDGTFDRQLGTGLGNVFHGAIAPPGAVDGHHVSRDAPLEYDPLPPAPLRRVRHGWISRSSNGRAARRRAAPSARLRPRSEEHTSELQSRQYPVWR